MSPITSSEIRLASRPRGWPTAENFTLARVEVPPPSNGQMLVRNLFMSVDPYMRGRMNDVKSYVPPFEVGQPLEGGAIGEVVESRAAEIRPGEAVLSMRGWREYFVADARELRVVDKRVQPVSLYLGALGMPGLTAWVGLAFQWNGLVMILLLNIRSTCREAMEATLPTIELFPVVMSTGLKAIRLFAVL